MVTRVGYEESTQTLGVEYSSGHVYHYFDVPRMVYQELERAASKGQYIARCIKSFYRYARM